ncbi:MAG: hypothetical protein ACYCTH_13440 [Cellulomonas sp.]
MVDQGGRTDDIEVAESGDGFIYFRMTGERFNATGMPADSVVEVQRFSELLYQVARAVWLERNQGRFRVPSEMVKAFDLRLVSVGEGSSMPRFRLAAPSARAGDEEDFTPIFQRARDIVVDSIASVADDRKLPDDFPRTALPSLQRFGNTIAGNETIQLAQPRPPSAGTAAPTRLATLSAQVHQTIKDIDAVLASDPAPQTIEGVITEFDGARGTFEIRDLHDATRTCRLAYNEPLVAERVKSVLAPDGVTAPDVRISGMGVVDHRGRIGDLWDVLEVEILRSAEEKMLVARLSAVAELPAGWWGPRSETPDREAVRNVEAALPELARSGVVIAITANSAGAVVLEWHRGDVEYTAQVEPGAALFLCADNTVTDEITERQGAYDARRLVRFVETGEIDD